MLVQYWFQILLSMIEKVEKGINKGNRKLD